MKPIPFKSNLRVADRVRKAINRLNESSLLMANAHFECFDNCREQGYVMHVYSEHVSHALTIAFFSENRNSDDIVVYLYTDTAFPQNLPATDADWKNKRYFPYGKVDEAARFILQEATRFAHTGKYAKPEGN